MGGATGPRPCHLGILPRERERIRSIVEEQGLPRAGERAPCRPRRHFADARCGPSPGADRSLAARRRATERQRRQRRSAPLHGRTRAARRRSDRGADGGRHQKGCRPQLIFLTRRGIVQHQVFGRVRAAFWLGPVVLLCSGIGGWALPSLATVERGEPLCAARSFVARTASAGAAFFRQVRASGAPVQTVPGMPPVIDPKTLSVVDRVPVGISPQHVVPSWDLKTLWVANNGGAVRLALAGPHLRTLWPGHSGSGLTNGSLTPIDPKTGKPGEAIPVDDPYNLYFTPDGHSAIVVAEKRKRLDFRDPQTMALQQSISAPGCSGINHADFSIDGRYAIFTCEFRGGGLVKIDLVNRRVLGYLRFPKKGMPQDIRISLYGSRSSTADIYALALHDALR